MTVHIRDVLLTDVVFVGVDLLGTPADVQRCSGSLGLEIIPEGIVMGPPPAPGLPPVQGQTLRIPRERILIETSAMRTRLAKEYPADIDDVLSIIRLASLAIPPPSEDVFIPSAHGFNLQLVYEQDSGESARLYLAKRLFDYRRAQAVESWELSGGFGTIVFVDGPSRWTIKVEPRLQDEQTPLVFLDINVHVSIPGFPSEEDLTMKLTSLWDRAHSLVGLIDNE